jgi:hypothetical protein
MAEARRKKPMKTMSTSLTRIDFSVSSRCSLKMMAMERAAYGKHVSLKALHTTRDTRRTVYSEAMPPAVTITAETATASLARIFCIQNSQFRRVA